MIDNRNWILQYVLPGCLTVAWLLTGALEPSPSRLFISGAGLAVLLILVVLLRRFRIWYRVYHSPDTGLTAIVRPRQVEVLGMRLFRNIPIGIDLRGAAKGVFRSMWVRFEEAPGGQLTFVAIRPLRRGPTRLGFLVRRRSVGLSLAKRLIRVARDVVDDSAVLRASMHASYPHVGVTAGGLRDTLLAATGGVMDIEDL